jgi:UDP-N-acetylglucosamine--N-acetylmuramyl-(pentapeptide) pyrophosphoryl-undecaprenol N-acetylglucosamine transferase
MSDAQPYRLIISGGGTGGHIFPALAIANEFRQRHPDAHILFVGARGKMEMTRVPEAGYKIVGLWISGIQRKWSLANLLFPLKLIVSYGQAARIVNKYKPHAVIGTGGYASGPVMLAATRRNIPALIQEQNSYAGLTNKQLAAKVQRICVAYEGMEKYFPKEKIRLTGNPVRKDIINLAERQEHALGQFAFDTNLKTLLVLGGSLGARTINESMLAGIDKFIDAKVQVIWQTGRAYYESVKAQVKDKDLRKIRIHDFLHQMDLAYAASDVVISRAGALAISELCLAERPSILVPSPNVAEDHQTKNAISLASKEAAVVVKDEEARGRLVDEALKLLFDDHRCRLLSGNIAKLARPDATDQIVNEIEEMIRVAS